MTLRYTLLAPFIHRTHVLALDLWLAPLRLGQTRFHSPGDIGDRRLPTILLAGYTARLPTAPHTRTATHYHPTWTIPHCCTPDPPYVVLLPLRLAQAARRRWFPVPLLPAHTHTPPHPTATYLRTQPRAYLPHYTIPHTHGSFGWTAYVQTWKAFSSVVGYCSCTLSTLSY